MLTVIIVALISLWSTFLSYLFSKYFSFTTLYAALVFTSIICYKDVNFNKRQTIKQHSMQSNNGKTCNFHKLLF